MPIALQEKSESETRSPAAAVPSPLRSHRLKERAGDRAFRYFVLMFGLVIVALAFDMAYELATSSKLAWREFGWKFLVTSTWDPVQEIYGALPFVYGTLVSSALALLMAVPLGVGAAIFLAELAPKRISSACTFMIELLAAI